MLTFLGNSWHYVMGMAIVGSISALIVTGSVNASEGLPIITGVGSLLIGGTLGATVPK